MAVINFYSNMCLFIIIIEEFLSVLSEVNGSEKNFYFFGLYFELGLLGNNKSALNIF